MTWGSLDEARSDAMSCTRCRLAGGRTNVVWMDGNPHSALMFIGEAPGFHEDKQGVPFVGAAGKLLDGLLGEIGLDRSGCCIVNVLKCRPPNNRDPMPDEVESCRPFLATQISLIRPRVIVTLGNFATRFVCGVTTGISRMRGRRHEAYGAAVVPTFHPAAVLRGGGDASPVMQSVREDFRLVAAILAEAPREEAASAAVQDALF